MTLLFSWLFTLLLSVNGGVKHDFHTSLTEMSYNPATESLEVTIRMFTDDLELALTTQNGGKSVRINNTPSDPADAHIERYIRKHFALLSPTKEVKPIQYIGKEVEVDATWIYVEIPNCKAIKGFTLYNVLLLEQFDDQSNLVNILHSSIRKSFIFNQKTRIETYPF